MMMHERNVTDVQTQIQPEDKILENALGECCFVATQTTDRNCCISRKKHGYAKAMCKAYRKGPDLAARFELFHGKVVGRLQGFPKFVLLHVKY